MAGIVGYGAYVPINRIKTAEIARVWGEEAARIEKGLGILEKAVGGVDEDAATISVEAARNAVLRAGIDAKEIGAVYVGSESHPYAVKPTATIVAEAIGATPAMTAADLEFACKAGTAGMQMLCGMVDSKMMKYGMAIGADTAQGRPGDALEYSAASGGAAYIIGQNDSSLALIEDTYSYTTDTPDFWRREGAFYPLHSGRFTGQPAYFKHTLGAGQGILKKSGLKPEDFAYAIFHMPNGKFPLTAGKKLGFKKEQLEPGWIVPLMGNTYSGSSPTGFSATLDVAKARDLVLLVSFGSGAGSDAFIFKVTERIDEVRDKAEKVKDMLEKNRIYVDYGQYAKFRGKIIMND